MNNNKKKDKKRKTKIKNKLRNFEKKEFFLLLKINEQCNMLIEVSRRN